jgi:hypothetical protein
MKIGLGPSAVSVATFFPDKNQTFPKKSASLSNDWLKSDQPDDRPERKEPRNEKKIELTALCSRLMIDR